MRSFFNVILVVSACAAALSLHPAITRAGEPQSVSSTPVFPYSVQKTTLENGLTVMSVAFDSPGITAYYTVVRTGSRNEVEKGLSGFAHFFEHMMFRGTEAFPADKYNDVLKSLGADSNAFTTKDYTCYHMTIPATALATAVRIESDRFQNLKYDEPSFQKEARAVLGEYNKGASSPSLKLNEVMQNTAYTNHTYKHTTIGFLEDVKDMPNQYAYSKVFFERWYRPENCTIIVAGDVKHDELVSLAKQSYGRWKRGRAGVVVIPAEPPQTGPRSARVPWPLPTLTTLLLAYHIPAADPRNADVPALDILAQLLFGETSPLYEELVLQEQKAVQLFGEAEPNRDPGLFEIMVRVRRAEDLPVVRARIARALAEASSATVDPAKLSAIKSHLRYQFASGIDSADAVADAVATAIALTNRPGSINELFDAYDRVTAADLKRVAQRYFQLANETAVILETETKPGAPTSGATLLHSPGNPLVALRVVLRAGSQDDPRGKEGLAALTAAMVAEAGSKSRTYTQILAAFYPMAAQLSGSCYKETTVFAGVVHRDNLAAYIPIAAEMIAQPRFDPADFERLRNEALDYVTKYLRGNNDEALGKWALETELYKDHPYGHPDIGTATALKSITLDDVIAFHRRHYARKSLKIGLAGGFDPGAPERLEASFQSLAADGPPAPELPAPHPNKGLEITIVEKPAEATAISLGFPLALTRREDDFYALAVANSYLGEHRTFNGKLMQDLRGKRGLNYGDYSYIEDFIQEGSSTFPVPNNSRRQQYFSIWVRPVPTDKAAFALRAALWELDRLVQSGMSEQDFEATRAFLLNYSKLWVQTLSRRLGYAIDGEFFMRRDLVTELADRLPKLTVADVNAAVRKHLKSQGIKVAIVASNARALRELLTSGKPTPLAYDTEGTPADVLAEDKTIAAFPLKDVSVKIVPVDQMFEK